MGVMSLRLDEKEMRRIEAVAKKEKKDKSTMARELLSYGLTLFLLRRYKEGNVSLGTVAKELDLSISEAIDLLAEFGIQAPLEYDDYLCGIKTLKKF